MWPFHFVQFKKIMTLKKICTEKCIDHDKYVGIQNTL